VDADSGRPGRELVRVALRRAYGGMREMGVMARKNERSQAVNGAATGYFFPETLHDF
jgi:hypothetical protein